MQFHKIAEFFPLMEHDEFENLVADISRNGLIEPIWTYENKILDGRNRYLACEAAGTKPKYREYTGSDPMGFAVSMNIERRHLNPSQKSCLAVELEPFYEAAAKERMLSGKADPVSILTQGKSRDMAAEKMHVSSGYVAYAEEIKKDAPELFDEMKAGIIHMKDARREVKKRKRDKVIEEIRSQPVPEDMPSEFDVIVIDPPWPYGTKYDPDGRRAASPYPEQTLEEITAMSIPAKENCVLWLWTTHKFMRHSFAILDAWGFRDVAILTWVKSKMGLGDWLRSQSEFCIMAVKGKPIVDLSNQTTVIYGDMREHSRKPDEFYKMVDELCAGTKIDFYSREKRDGWYQYGNETEKF